MSCLDDDGDDAAYDDGDHDHDGDDDDDEPTRSSLPICKAGGHSSLKYWLDKRPADDCLDEYERCHDYLDVNDHYHGMILTIEQNEIGHLDGVECVSEDDNDDDDDDGDGDPTWQCICTPSH